MTPDVVMKTSRTPQQWISLAAIGLAAGFLSGMFGVGGGILIVPGLVFVLHFQQKLASGTSLAAIVPLSIVGVISYAALGAVSVPAALLVAAGSIAGARVGTRLLQVIRPKPLQVVFALFMIVVIISLYFSVPDRAAMLTITWISGLGMVAVGIVTGILSGLLGVGGGVIIVPALMLLFGASDLVAKGTSLLIMIPTALVGTFSNVQTKNVDIPAALTVGLPACITTFVGSSVAGRVSPDLANNLFSIFLAFVAAQLLWKTLKPAKK